MTNVHAIPDVSERIESARSDVAIGGEDYRVLEWRSNGLVVSSARNALRPGEIVSVRFALPGAAAQDIRMRVLELAEGGRRSELEFLDLSARELTLLRAVAHTDFEDIAAGEADFAEAPIRSDDLATRFRRALQLLLIWIIVIGLFTALGVSMYSRMFTVRGFATVLSAAPVSLRTPSSAILASAPLARGTRVRPGENVAVLDLGQGRQTQVVSPCACVVAGMAYDRGAFVVGGSEIASLAPLNDPLAIRAYIPLEQVPQIRPGDRATVLLLSDRSTAAGRVARIDVPIVGAEAGVPLIAERLQAIVTIRLNQSLPATTIGEAGTVRISTLRWPIASKADGR